MKFLLLCTFLAFAYSITIRAHQQNKEQGNITPITPAPLQIVGGFTGRVVNGEKDLDDQEKKMVQFIHKNIPDIVNYNLVYTKKQVVAGMNYCFDYQSKLNHQTILKICVWSQVWENNFLRLTTSDGRVFTSGGPIQPA